MEKTKWNQSEIEQMKRLYVNNQPLKIIARLLNRTPTSINKALSRFGIRQHRTTKAKSPSRGLPSVALLQRIWQHSQNERQWVSLDYVHQWLRGRKVLMHKSICPVTGQIHFTQGSARLTPAHVVMLFNKKRLEEGLEVCWVEKVSC